MSPLLDEIWLEYYLERRSMQDMSLVYSSLRRSNLKPYKP